MSSSLFRRRLGAIFAAAAFFLTSIVGAEDSAPEAALKAVFIYNFTKFVEWPPSVPSNQLRLCTVEDNAVTEALATFEGRMSMGRTVKLQSTSKISSLQQCQIVYLANISTSQHIAEMISQLKDKPVLTVSDREDFLDQGGMISIVRNADRLSFEVDLPIIQAAQLKVAAPLLRMAKTVRQ